MPKSTAFPATAKTTFTADDMHGAIADAIDIKNEIHDATLLPMQKLDAIAWLLQSVKVETSLEDDFFQGLGGILQDIHAELDAAGGGQKAGAR
jgi:hypothetical protein